MADDARSLFDVGPADYVAERDRMVKELRADGDKAGAAAIKQLKRPSLSMWAVLAAGGDDRAVRELVDATQQLATVQGGGGDRASIQDATRRRRDLVDGLTDSAIAALGRYEQTAAARRIEVRGMVDQLARHPELADAWIDGTLRDLPEAGSGFEAFQEMVLPTREPKAIDQAVTKTATKTASTRSRPAEERAAQREAEQRRKAALAEAREVLRDAERGLAEARRVTHSARRDLERATTRLQQAEAAEHAAQAAVADAAERVDGFAPR